MGLEIVPAEATLGAAVTGVDLADLDEAAFAAIERAWDEHAVLVFPEQHLSEAEQGRVQPPPRPARAQPHGKQRRRRPGDHRALQHARRRHAVARLGARTGCSSRATITGTPIRPTSASRPRARRSPPAWCPGPAARPPSPTCARPGTRSTPACGATWRTSPPSTATPTARARSAAPRR